jgi:hypothetical protein
MYKLMTLSVVLVALALAPVLGGVSAEGTLREPMNAIEASELSEQLSAPPASERRQHAETSACDWACEACESDQGCQQTCTEIGDCGSTCGVMARCDAQHVWNDQACACVSR